MPSGAEIEAGAVALYIEQNGPEWTNASAGLAELYRHEARLVLEAAERIRYEEQEQDDYE